MYNDKQKIAEIYEITASTSNIKVGNQPKTSDKYQLNKINKKYTFWGNCWKCGEFGTQQKNVKITQLWPLKPIKVKPT